MKGIFLNIEKFFKSRGMDFTKFCTEMNKNGIYELALLRTMAQFDKELETGKIWADFSDFKRQFYHIAKDIQAGNLTDEYIPLIKETYKHKVGTFSKLFGKGGIYGKEIAKTKIK